MNRAKSFLMLSAMIASTFSGFVQAQEGAAGEPEPLKLSLMDCVKSAFKNNKEIGIASYAVDFRNEEITRQESQFDPNWVSSGSYQDASSPSATIDPFSGKTIVVPTDSTITQLETNYSDPLRYGANWSADLSLIRRTSTGLNLGSIVFTPPFPKEYRATFQLEYNQSLLKNFGRKVNETQITIESTNKDIDEEDFRSKVQATLLEVEDAYWTLVFEREDLEVRKEALALAQELLRLNKIRVDVGTLPPIDITQAEAGVASREEAVIIAEANIRNAEDRLRRVLGMDPQDPEWGKPIVPTQDLTIVQRDITLDQEIKTGIENRTDLASARLRLKIADTSLSYQRDQLRPSLNFLARYTLSGLAGQDTMGTNDNMQDALKLISDAEFPTYYGQLTFGIPIGNRNAQSQYVRTRLEREQRGIEYENLEQQAMVQIGVAARKVLTDRKRIDAAEKNRILQEKTVEAEQKKFENGLSTSFQVLEFQKDLAEARSAENAAKRDYRISLANLDSATGVLEKTYNIEIADYSRE